MDKVTVYTEAELAAHTELIMQEIAESGRAARIIRMGQVVAVIVPLDDVEAIATALSVDPVAEAIAQRIAAGGVEGAELAEEAEGSGIYTRGGVPLGDRPAPPPQG
jgi:antitoxin (DNA-binding transcriptional repressor) of toxin-antitoxin stability system